MTDLFKSVANLPLGVCQEVTVPWSEVGRLLSIRMWRRGRCKTTSRLINSKLTRTLFSVPDSPEFKSKHDDDTVDLSTARNFRSLVEALREHLVSSKSTRLSYVSMAKNIHMELPHDIQLVTTPPNDDDFLSFLKSDWPTFRSRRARKNKIRWGYVQKGEGKSHTIRILSSIVESAESAVSTLFLIKHQLGFNHFVYRMPSAM